MKRFLFAHNLFFLSLSACLEPYEIKLDNYEDIIVVDVTIKNQTGSYYVKIIKTNTDYNQGFENITKSTVVISDINGVSETLTHVKAVLNKTSETGIQGEINNSSKIYIKPFDNKEYDSEYWKLSNPCEEISVDEEFDSQSVDITGDIYCGYQFYVNPEINDESLQYYKWEPTETYEYHSTYKMDLYAVYGVVYEFPNPDSIYRCWNALSKLSNNGESLINIQPFQVEENIRNINDETKVVLGWFTIAGSSEQMIFADPIRFEINIDNLCVPNDTIWNYAIAYNRNRIVYEIFHEGELGAIGGSCIDCRQREGT